MVSRSGNDVAKYIAKNILLGIIVIAVVTNLHAWVEQLLTKVGLSASIIRPILSVVDTSSSLLGFAMILMVSISCIKALKGNINEGKVIEEKQDVKEAYDSEDGDYDNSIEVDDNTESDIDIESMEEIKSLSDIKRHKMKNRLRK